ncbi:hypothetical protein C8Q77DRAFT_1153148 [Trametes polyzona]|nr:hypothetical protein C8Q77DRAFT_1153148 [Trametes polyzona]
MGDRYKSIRTLRGHNRGVMAVDLTGDGTLLASGGGDGVKVWDLRSGTSLSTPAYRSSVGPTSKLLWITAPASDRHTLCYGTGLGYLCIWMENSHRGVFSELCSKRLGDGGEITALASVHNKTADTRIAVGTRTFIIQVYQYNGRDDLLPIFSARDVHVFGLHDGAMHTVGGKDGKILQTKQLARQMGHACLDAKREYVLIDNIEDGFDMFDFKKGIFIRSFPTGIPG